MFWMVFFTYLWQVITNLSLVWIKDKIVDYEELIKS